METDNFMKAMNIANNFIFCYKKLSNLIGGFSPNERDDLIDRCIKLAEINEPFKWELRQQIERGVR